MDYTNCIK